MSNSSVGFIVEVLDALTVKEVDCITRTRLHAKSQEKNRFLDGNARTSSLQIATFVSGPSHDRP